MVQAKAWIQKLQYFQGSDDIYPFPFLLGTVRSWRSVMDLSNQIQNNLELILGQRAAVLWGCVEAGILWFKLIQDIHNNTGGAMVIRISQYLSIRHLSADLSA